MSQVGIVVHPSRAEAHALARKATDWLIEAGHRVRLSERDAGILSRSDLSVEIDRFGEGLDFAMSIGGDGSMLATVSRVARWHVPVLGVNMGHLGYLTEVEPPQLLEVLPRILGGDYEVAERLLLDVVTDTAVGGVSEAHLAVNEAVVEKIPLGHTVRLGLELDGNRFTSYAADGMIVATPVGSTAYAFSVRGPIVDPNHRAILVSPVAPHMLFDRSLVLSPETEVVLTLEGDRPAVLAIDGGVVIELEPGDQVRCSSAAVSARLIKLGDHNFHETLKRKFGLSER